MLFKDHYSQEFSVFGHTAYKPTHTYAHTSTYRHMHITNIHFCRILYPILILYTVTIIHTITILIHLSLTFIFETRQNKTVFTLIAYFEMTIYLQFE